MEDPDTQLLREKFRPSGANYRWHKMASEIRPLVEGALGKISVKTNKQGQQEKYKTKTMVASNTPAVAKNLKHQPGRKERVTWRPEEKEKVVEKVVEKFREEGMNVPGIGPVHNRENGRFLEIVRAAQEEALPRDRWKAFTQRNHIEQSKLIEPLKQRLENKPIVNISMNDMAAAVDEALAAKNSKAVVHLPIQTKEQPAKDVTTTGREVRVINIDSAAEQHKKKVWWKTHEFTAVLTLAVNKLRSLGVGTLPTKDDYSGSRMLLEVFNSAQHQMLPRERWKKLTSRAQLESIGLLENLQTLLRQAPKQTPAETASVPPPVPEPSREVPVAPPPQGPGPVSPAASAPPFQPPAPKPSELPENEIMAALQVLGRAITRGLAFEKQAAELTEMNTLLMEEVDGLRKRIETLDTAVRGMNKVERKEEAKAKVELPVVAVLGCRKEQFDQICTKAEERGLKLTLRHYDQDSAPRPISAQWAVSLRWVRHHWEDQVKKSGIPMSQYSFLPHGGVSQAVQMLELWFGGAA